MSTVHTGVSSDLTGQVDHLAGREVVVGYDGGAPAAAAVRWAAREADRLGSRLTIVYAANAPAVATWTPGAEQLTSELAGVSERTAADGAAIARATAPRTPVRSLGIIGGAAGELVARSAEAGLLVVGRRRRGAIQAAALGSVSFAVILHARCPVVVVQDGAERLPGPDGGPVVVGVDGSHASHGALDLAAQVASAWRAPLQVLAAWSVPTREPWTAGLGPRAARAARREAEERAVRVGSAALDRLQATGCGAEVAVRVVEGEAERLLVEASKSAGLVVVGSRGHGGFAGMMLGSVGHGVLRRAASPVAVVRRGSW